MVGLELTISGKTISISAEQGVASIIVTQTRNAAIDSIDLNVSGLNIANGSTGEMLDWYKTNLNVGDELVIRVKEIAETTKPENVRVRNNKESS